MWAIFQRELRTYFTTPIGYIFVGFFLLIAGIFFALTNIMGAAPDFKSVLGSLLFIFLIVVPVLTMRLLSEEARFRTDQLLLSSPVSITGIVLGKYLAAVGVFLATLAVTFSYPLIMSFYSMGRLAVWEIVGGYIGFFLLGASFIAVGLFISSLTENPFIAAVETFGALLFMWIIDWIQPSLPADSGSGLVLLAASAAGLAALIYFSTRSLPVVALAAAAMTAALAISYAMVRSWYQGVIARLLDWFSLVRRFQDFGLGILSLSPVVYYLSFSAAFVFLTVRVIAKRRWI
jgi:ABC-2 type transport system permease protein